MTKETYLINEVAKEVHVESHVLRYWEEELDIPITRNRQGHRVYTQEDINRFVQIKNLKDQGLQLKAVKLVLNQLQESEDEEKDMKQDNPFIQKHETKMNKGGEMNVIQIKEMKSLDKRESMSHNRKNEYRNELTVRRKEEMARDEQEQQEKLARMQYLIQKMIADAVKSNNKILINELSEQMKENICKEMDYQFRLLEEHEEEREAAREEREEARERARRVAEEEHYKRIDSMLRERRLKVDKSKNKEKGKEPILFRALSKSKV
ncbi:MAG: MerR family transcriptional regulator [Lachnospiraceae bacterium]|nr:MerR family transcriptional regulator [Lachnospiraceae bacterium]